MGCDIHLHVEIKLNGQWEHYTQPNVPRDYALFEKMAGVRGERLNAIAPPRGLPADASVVTRFDADHMGIDGHSHSYLSAEEIVLLNDWAQLNLSPRHAGWSRWDMEVEWGCYLFGNSFAGFHKYPEDQPKGLQDIRFVFWFDN